MKNNIKLPIILFSSIIYLNAIEMFNSMKDLNNFEVNLHIIFYIINDNEIIGYNSLPLYKKNYFILHY